MSVIIKKMLGVGIIHHNLIVFQVCVSTYTLFVLFLLLILDLLARGPGPMQQKGQLVRNHDVIADWPSQLLEHWLGALVVIATCIYP